jgi:hypothetical protein
MPLYPPGIAEKPVELVAPELGRIHPLLLGAVMVLLKGPLILPTKLFKTIQSPLLGTRHPVGHNPLESETAKLLYILPKKSLFDDKSS